jgi:hypothetical protein
MGVSAGKSYPKREPENALPVEFKDGEAHAPPASASSSGNPAAVERPAGLFLFNSS